MVAVGGAGDRNGAGGVAKSAGLEHSTAGIGGDAGARKLVGQDLTDRVGAAERLEAAEAEPSGFILDLHRCDPGLPRDVRNIVQRRRRVAGPCSDLGLGAAKAGSGQNDGAGGSGLGVDEQSVIHATPQADRGKRNSRRSTAMASTGVTAKLVNSQIAALAAPATPPGSVRPPSRVTMPPSAEPKE